jgi:hypothetical protein
VPVPDFFFALEVSSQGVPAALIEDLAEHVFTYVHCAATQVEGLSDALARAAGTGASRCDVQFRAKGGELDVLVTSNGGRIWQTSIQIPDAPS